MVASPVSFIKIEAINMENKLSDVSVGTIHKSNHYGLFKVVEHISPQCVTVEFLDTGYRRITQNSHIRRGSVCDKLFRSYAGVGFIGAGEHKVNGPNASKDAYIVWRAMINRCYDNKNAAYHNYGFKGAIVCDEWHNFQIFADWYYLNHPSDGNKYHVDKDIKYDGNMLYSPGTCLFVTPAENTEKAWAMNWRFTSPSGDIVTIYNLSKFCRENNLSSTAMGMVSHGKRESHKGWTRPKTLAELNIE